MSSALTDCLQFLEHETKACEQPYNSIRNAVIFLKSYEDRRAFLDKLTDYHEGSINFAIFQDALTPYAISRLRKGRLIKDIANEAARTNLHQVAMQLDTKFPDCYKEWADFLINC